MNEERVVASLSALAHGNRLRIFRLLVKRGPSGLPAGVIADSAGSQPSGKVHPIALDLLKRLGYDTSGLRSKSWEEFTAPDAPELDFVFTVCDNAANEVCPVWPGQPMTAHWGVPDPSVATGND